MRGAKWDKKLSNNLFVQKTNRSKQAANAENHTSCIQNEWQQEKRGSRGIHSFLSYDAEMDEGVHTGQVKQSVLAIIWRDVVFLRLRWAPGFITLLVEVSSARGQNGGKTTFLVWLKWICFVNVERVSLCFQRFVKFLALPSCFIQFL